jgi:hypothetical protein
MTMAVVIIQASITAMDTQAGNQSNRPANKNIATPMTIILMVSQMA